MKRLFVAGVLLLLLLIEGGCASWFKDKEKPLHNPGVYKSGSRRQKSAKKKRRDPVNDMFFGIGSGAKTPECSLQGLGSEEQDIVRKELRRQDDEMRALKERHRTFNSDRSKRKEWVYGFKPLSDR